MLEATRKPIHETSFDCEQENAPFMAPSPETDLSQSHTHCDTAQSNEIRDLKALLSNLPGMAYRCRNQSNWPMQFVSEGATELCGYSPEDLYQGNPHWGAIIHPDDQETVWQSVQLALQRKESFKIQYRIVTKNNQCKWVWERGGAVDSDEHGVLIEGFITDITPLREKELALEHSEALANAIIESAAEGIVLVNDTGGIGSLNHAAELMFDLQLNSVQGTYVRDLLTTESYKLLKCDTQKFLESGESKLFSNGREMVGRRSDGAEFSIHLTVRMIRLDGGNCFAALVRDVSLQKANEIEIRRQTERLKATIEFSPIGITMIDTDLKILAANPAFCNMIGYNVNELIGHRFADITHPDDIDITERAARRGLSNGPRHHSIRKRYIHKDGHIVHTLKNFAIGCDDNGVPEFAVANIEDLTPRLNAEALFNEQQNQLNRLDRLCMLGEMAAGIAHEINQPLTAISLFAQAGKRLYSNNEHYKVKEIFDKLSLHAQRAGAVIVRMQNMARRQEDVREIVDCNELIIDVAKLAESEALIRDIAIKVEIHPKLPHVAVDAIQIQQVALNLLRNGMESMQSQNNLGINTIRIQTKLRTDGDIEVMVVDSGNGVSEEMAKKIFTPFSTTKESGLGMGLSISQAIISAHGGLLDFYNNESGGATFFFTLPPTDQGDTNE